MSQTHPRIYNATGTPLTVKQVKFVKEVVRDGSPTRAAMKVYDVKDVNGAKAIAQQNLAKTIIRKSIQEHLELAGYNPTQSIINLQKNAKAGLGVKATAADSIRADELLLKLAGMVVDRHQSVNVNVDISKLSKDKLLNLKDNFDKMLNE